MKRIIAALAATLTLAAVTAAPAQADIYIGPKWQSPVTVSDRTGDPSLEVSRAVNRWHWMGAPISMTSSSTAPITVSYTDTLTDGAAAVAWMSWSNTTMIRCDVKVADSMAAASRTLKRKVIGHELGHCIGLSHRPDGVYSIMSNGMFQSPTFLDWRAVRGLYR